MSEENKALIRRWFEEVWNKGREEAIDEMFAEDGIAHGLADESGEDMRGPTDYKPFFRKFREAFPTSKSSSKTPLPRATRSRRVARCAASISQIVWALLRPNSQWRSPA